MAYSRVPSKLEMKSISAVSCHVLRTSRFTTILSNRPTPANSPCYLIHSTSASVSGSESVGGNAAPRIPARSSRRCRRFEANHGERMARGKYAASSVGTRAGGSSQEPLNGLLRVLGWWCWCWCWGGHGASIDFLVNVQVKLERERERARSNSEKSKGNERIARFMPVDLSLFLPCLGPTHSFASVKAMALGLI
jgi:hypothetical protein